MQFVGSDLALKVIGDSHLLRPGDLDGTLARNMVDRVELHRVAGHIVKTGIFLMQFVDYNRGGKLIFDTVSFLCGVSSDLVVVLVLDLDLYEGFGWLSGNGVAHVFNAPTEVTHILFQFLEFDLHDTS